MAKPNAATPAPDAQKSANAGGPGVAPAQDRLSAVGIDAIAARICDGEPLTKLADSLGVSFGSLQTWLESNPERLARAREARRLAARMWDEKALEEIQAATDTISLAKAREAAQHYRWRASKIAPGDYGERQAIEHTGKDGGPIQTQRLEEMTPAQRRARINELCRQQGLRSPFGDEF